MSLKQVLRVAQRFREQHYLGMARVREDFFLSCFTYYSLIKRLTCPDFRVACPS